MAFDEEKENRKELNAFLLKVFGVWFVGSLLGNFVGSLLAHYFI
jgi:hypothetical protein